MARKAASFRSTARLAPSSPRDLYIIDWPGSKGPDAGLPLESPTATYNAFGQAQGQIKAIGVNGFGQAQAKILGAIQVFGNAQADIKATLNVFGQSQAGIKQTYRGYGQAQGQIKQTYKAFGQAQGSIINTYFGFGQAQAKINAFGAKAYGQAQGYIKAIGTKAYGQAQGYIRPRVGLGQAQAFISGPVITFTGFETQDFKMEILRDIGSPPPSKFDLQNTVAYKDSGYALIQQRVGTSTADNYFIGWSDPRAVIGADSWIDLDQLYVEFEFRSEGFAGVDDTILTFARSAGNSNLRVQYINSGSTFQLQYWTGGAWTNVSSASFSVTTGIWYRIGVSLQILSNGDEIIVGYRLNGTDIISPTRLNPSATFSPTSAILFGSTLSIGAQTYYWDNVVVRTDGFQGTSATALLEPDADGSYTSWSNGFANIDELPPDDITTIIFLADGVTGRESVNLQSATSTLPTNIQKIDAIKVHAKALRNAADRIDLFYRIGGVDYDVGRPNPFTFDGGWYAFDDVKSKNPATGVNWTKSDLDSLEIGVNKTDPANIARVTVLFITILYTPFTGGFGQANALIEGSTRVFGQAQAYTKGLVRGYGNAQADIKQVYRGYGQAQGYITTGIFGFGQAQADIKKIINVFGQSQGLIIGKHNAYGRAQGEIKATTRKFGQAQAFVIRYTNAHGQAQARIKLVRRAFGQAQAKITTTKPVGQAQAFILSQRYLVQYNGYQLPGYAQEENFDSVMRIETMKQPYRDMSFSEYLGLENKSASLRILVMGPNYLNCKNQIELAGTMLRSQRAGFRPLYVQHYNKHYDALVKTIKLEADVHTNKTAEYTVDFECKPWLESDILTTISGASTINRTIDNGGWTPANLTLTGTNITVSGYTATGDFTGFISVSGVVAGLQIDTEKYTATMANENANGVILNDDYQLYIGPGQTFFTVTGATNYEISYHDRWYL